MSRKLVVAVGVGGGGARRSSSSSEVHLVEDDQADEYAIAGMFTRPTGRLTVYCGENEKTYVLSSKSVRLPLRFRWVYETPGTHRRFNRRFRTILISEEKSSFSSGAKTPRSASDQCLRYSVNQGR